MHAISSTLTSTVQEFVPVRSALAERGFDLGGGWDYDHGSFDCALDDRQQVWLRIPFDVTIGNLDSETEENDAKIRFRQPYVLKHQYNEGSDPEARMRLAGGLIDQFSDPVDPDAAVEPEWIDRAERKLREVEELYPS